MKRFYCFSILFVYVLLCGCSASKPVIRNVSWGMSMEQVVASEKKNSDFSDASEYEGTYMVLGADCFGRESNVTYGFSEENKLNHIIVIFEQDHTLDDYSQLGNELEETYGTYDEEDIRDSSIKLVWNKENTKITLLYVAESSLTDEGISVLFSPVEHDK